MAIYHVTPTGSPTASGTSSGAAWSLDRALGNVSGQSKPQAWDTVLLYPGTYGGFPKAINVTSSGGPIIFKNQDDAADTIFDGASNAANGVTTARVTGWTRVADQGAGPGVRVYGGSAGNSGTSAPYIYFKDGFSGVQNVFCDDYVGGSGTLKSPGSTNYWWVTMWNMGTNGGVPIYNTDNSNFPGRMHDVVGGVSTDGGNLDTQGFGGRTEHMHDWRGQFVVEGSRLYIRCHTSGDMSVGSPPHNIYTSHQGSYLLLGGSEVSGQAPGISNVTFDGGPNKRIKLYRGKRGFGFYDSSNVTIQNIESKWMNNEGIFMGRCNNMKVLGCRIYGGNHAQHVWGCVRFEFGDNCEVGNCEMAYAGHECVGFRNVNNCWVHDNFFHHLGGYGVYFYGQPGGGHLVERNLFQDIGYIDTVLIHKTPHGAINCGSINSASVFRRNEMLRCGVGWWKSGQGYSNVQFYNNTIYKSEYAGLFIDDQFGSATGAVHDNLYQNNIIAETVGHAGSGWNAIAIWFSLWDSNNHNAWNNDFRYNDLYTPLAAGGGTQQIRLGSYANQEPQYALTNHTVTEFQGGGGNPVPSWMSANTGNNVTGNPNMEAPNTGDFDTNAGSPAINSGSTSGLTLTFAGHPDAPADVGTRDMGARENGAPGGGGGTNNAPSVNLSTNGTSGNAPLTVNFTANATDDITPGSGLIYAWNFGDVNATSGNTVNGTGAATFDSRTFTYNHPGVYTATVTVTDAGGLFTTRTVLITVGSSRGGTKIVSTAGFTFSTAGGGSIPAPGTQTADKLMNQRYNTSVPAGSLTNDTWSQSGVGGGVQRAIVAFGTTKTINRLRVSGYNWDTSPPRVHTFILETSVNGTTWVPVHTPATWLTLSGSGNEFTEIDFAQRTGITHVRLSETLNSSGSDFSTWWELEVYEAGGGGGGTGLPFAIVDAYDHIGPDNGRTFGPRKTIDLKGPTDGDPASRWIGGAIIPGVSHVTWDLGQSRAIKSMEFALFEAVKGRVYTYTVLTSPDDVTYTPILTGQQNGATAWQPHVNTPSVWNARYVRIQFTAVNNTACLSLWEGRFLS